MNIGKGIFSVVTAGQYGLSHSFQSENFNAKHTLRNRLMIGLNFTLGTFGDALLKLGYQIAAFVGNLISAGLFAIHPGKDQTRKFALVKLSDAATNLTQMVKESIRLVFAPFIGIPVSKLLDKVSSAIEDSPIGNFRNSIEEWANPNS